MKISFAFVLSFILCWMCSSQNQIYFNDFDGAPIGSSTTSYIGDPVLHSAIESTEWDTEDATYTTMSGYQGDALGLSHGGTDSYYLELEIDEYYELDITAFNFWAKKEQGDSSWELYIDNEVVDDGNTSSAGAFIGETPASETGLTGTVLIELRINGMGNSIYSLDDFELFGELTLTCPEISITPPEDDDACQEGQASFEVAATPEPESLQWEYLDENDQWQALSNDANYSGTHTTTLTISDIPLDFDQNQYRCVISLSEECSEASQEAILTVHSPPPPISINYY